MKPGNVVDSLPDPDDIFSQPHVDHQTKNEKKRDEAYDQPKSLVSIRRFGILDDKGLLPIVMLCHYPLLNFHNGGSGEDGTLNKS
jgi:hypothetical protein